MEHKHLGNPPCRAFVCPQQAWGIKGCSLIAGPSKNAVTPLNCNLWTTAEPIDL
jgi:hypothetical protein